ncbi:MAG: L-serine ammonia-lyase, iron-sulfur-dependent, subunit alpha [Desulfobacterales bacterium]|nr:L-serine ammonia-lyase, iron-sulfur-dependent, subunit alpha [Desulfobacterales bacterium]
MTITDKQHEFYLDVLHKELVPATGCTEPISLAYAAARAREVLGKRPDRVEIEASSNIIKNVKSVVVPNTGNLRGIEAAAAAGIVAGEPDKVLEVISAVDDTGQKKIRTFLETTDMTVCPSKNDLIFDLCITVFHGESSASVRISHYHSNIVLIKKDGKVVYQDADEDRQGDPNPADQPVMTVKDILAFAGSVSLSAVSDLLQRQIDFNFKIAEEGIRGDWGANIGTVLLETWGNDIKIKAKAMAAAGSDARMSGCELPVVIVSGSGNQGIAASVPVIVYAREMGVEKEDLFRALLVSNLVTIHQKTGIGRLSAYCGAVSAGVGAGAGIARLHGGRFEDVAHTIVNALAIVSGIICDGAKPSCAAKIAASVEAGILGFHMYQKGQQFYSGDGIIAKDVERTINNIGRLARFGMRETDREIIKLMIQD